jgi:hypothetical protein
VKWESFAGERNWVKDCGKIREAVLGRGFGRRERGKENFLGGLRTRA